MSDIKYLGTRITNGSCVLELGKKLTAIDLLLPCFRELAGKI
jgi:hypothetical protein